MKFYPFSHFPFRPRRRREKGVKIQHGAAKFKIIKYYKRWKDEQIIKIVNNFIFG